MKKALLVLMILVSLNILAQRRTNVFFRDYVECYYSDKETEPIVLHASPYGAVITELNDLTQSDCWYKFAISESYNGWLKIENVMVLPRCEENEINNKIEKYKDAWIRAKNLMISLPDITEDSGIQMNFYENPDKKSNITFTAVKYLVTELIDVSGTWAKVKFTKDDILYTGWIERKYQCPYPWTTCPIWD